MRHTLSILIIQYDSYQQHVAGSSSDNSIDKLVNSSNKDKKRLTE